jgi:hypothetical protein
VNGTTLRQEEATLPSPWFHADSGALRFWVALPDGQLMGAVLSARLLQFLYQAHPDGSDAIAVYESNRGAIDAAVLRRAAAGSLEPVMLRENDLPPRPRA